MAYPKVDFAMLLPDNELPNALRRLSPIFTRTTGFLAKASWNSSESTLLSSPEPSEPSEALPGNSPSLSESTTRVD